MRKKELKNILKELKKVKAMNGISFEPTLEECDYLQEHGVNVSPVQWSRPSIIDYSRKYLLTLTSLEVANND